MWFLGLLRAAERKELQRELLGATRERMLREMAEAVEALTAERPLVFVLENLHWSDYATLDLVAALARRRESARLLLIGTYRPVEVILRDHPLKAVKTELERHGRCRELPLELSSQAAVAGYLAARYSEGSLAGELAQLIHERTDGLPLFMVMVMEELVARGVLGERDGRWALQGGLEAVRVGVPESIRQMLEQQFERLSRGSAPIWCWAGEARPRAIGGRAPRWATPLSCVNRCSPIRRCEPFFATPRLVLYESPNVDNLLIASRAALRYYREKRSAERSRTLGTDGMPDD